MVFVFMCGSVLFIYFFVYILCILLLTDLLTFMMCKVSIEIKSVIKTRASQGKHISRQSFLLKKSS